MSYATFEQLQAIYSLALLDRLCLRAGDADAGTPPDTAARCEMALESAGGIMDSFFMVVYPVPLSPTVASTSATLRNCNAALAVAELILQLGYVTGSEDEQLLKSARGYWYDWLASVRNGKTMLPGVSYVVGEGQVDVPSPFVTDSEPSSYPSFHGFC